MASLPVSGDGHEGFVQPSSYLRRPGGQSQSMSNVEPESAVERDQRFGLVSYVFFFYFLLYRVITVGWKLEPPRNVD